MIAAVFHEENRAPSKISFLGNVWIEQISEAGLRQNEGVERQLRLALLGKVIESVYDLDAAQRFIKSLLDSLTVTRYFSVIRAAPPRLPISVAQCTCLL